jgi:chloramphenicol-sensitive protein RarD
VTTAAPPGRAESSRGYAAAIGAYTVWGLFPAFWQALGPAEAVEILAHRIAWTLVLMALVVTVVGRWRALRGLPARTWLLIAAASVLIAVNWGVYIWAANHGRVVDSALGYYIQPLFIVVLGVLVLGERLRTTQWVAIGIATVAVLVLTAGTGTFPWVGLVLAAAFALYGLIKKTVPLDPVPGLVAEGFALGPVAIAYLVVLEVSGAGTFLSHGVGHAALLAATGPATAVPLLLFAVGAKHLTLTVLGVLQYINPTLQFLLGAVVEGEPMPPARWIGFALVWLALLVFSLDAVRSRRRAVDYPVRSTV